MTQRSLSLAWLPPLAFSRMYMRSLCTLGLRAQGAIFVDELHDVPNGATVIFSAHGVPACVRAARTLLSVLEPTKRLIR